MSHDPLSVQSLFSGM